MKQSELKQAIQDARVLMESVFVWGAPGIGKSAIIYQLSCMLDILFKDVRVLLLDPTDLKGFPDPFNGDTVKWKVPDFWPKDGEGIILLDELNLGSKMVQDACYQLIHDRKVGDYEVPAGWTIVAAGNRETDGCGVKRQSAALASRFIHVTLDHETEEFKAEFLKYARENGFHPIVLGYLSVNKAAIFKYDKTALTFANPRTWEKVSKMCKLFENGDRTDSYKRQMFQGCVGEGEGNNFFDFYKNCLTLPNPKQILKDPVGTWPVDSSFSTSPEKMGQLYMVCTALARLVDKSTIDNMTVFLNTLPMREFGTFTMEDAIAQHPELMKTDAYIQWQSKIAA